MTYDIELKWILNEMRRKSPIAIQRWIDTIPTTTNNDIFYMSQQKPTQPIANSPRPNSSNNLDVRHTKRDLRGAVLSRDSSFQSEASSYGSSVESVLELRKPDPEEILINLGFGPSNAQKQSSRIPKRFLHPSEAKGIDISRFIKEYEAQEAAKHFYLNKFKARSMSKAQNSLQPLNNNDNQ